MEDSNRQEIMEILLAREVRQQPMVDRLFQAVYQELRKLAVNRLRHERPGHTLQPTALVHEAYLRLVDQTRIDWQGRTHFLAVAASAMRRVLIDHARAHNRDKRGGGNLRVTLDEALAQLPSADIEMMALHDALKKLAALDERQAKVVEMRFLGGLSIDEIALSLNLSKRTIENELTHARAWLKRALNSAN